MVPIQNVKMAVGLIWNTGGTETVISVPVSVLGPQRAGTEMGGDRLLTAHNQLWHRIKFILNSAVHN